MDFFGRLPDFLSPMKSFKKSFGRMRKAPLTVSFHTLFPSDTLGQSVGNNVSFYQFM